MGDALDMILASLRKLDKLVVEEIDGGEIIVSYAENCDSDNPTSGQLNASSSQNTAEPFTAEPYYPRRYEPPQSRRINLDHLDSGNPSPCCGRIHPDDRDIYHPSHCQSGLSNSQSPQDLRSTSSFRPEPRSTLYQHPKPGRIEPFKEHLGESRIPHKSAHHTWEFVAAVDCIETKSGGVIVTDFSKEVGGTLPPILAPLFFNPTNGVMNRLKMRGAFFKQSAIIHLDEHSFAVQDSNGIHLFSEESLNYKNSILPRLNRGERAELVGLDVTANGTLVTYSVKKGGLYLFDPEMNCQETFVKVTIPDVESNPFGRFDGQIGGTLMRYLCVDRTAGEGNERVALTDLGKFLLITVIFGICLTYFSLALISTCVLN